MKHEDKKKFAETLKFAAIAYNNDCTQDVLRVYFELLEDYTIEQVQVAVKAHCVGTGHESKFFPKAADLICQIRGTKAENKADTENMGLAQWQTVLNCIRKYGSYQTPVFNDPITKACVSNMGWRTICGMEMKELDWKGKEFVQMYGNYSTRPLDQLPGHIAGREDIQKLKNSDSAIGGALSVTNKLMTEWG